MAGEKPSTQVFGHATNPVYSHGMVFHRMAEQFIEWLQNTDEATRADTADSLWEQLYRTVAARQLDLLMLRPAPAEALELARALRAFCGQQARLRASARLFESWRDVYAGHEHAIQDVAFPFESATVFVSGRVDSLRRLPNHELEVADYKLHRSDDRSRDFLQLAIYAALLSRNNPALRFCGALEYYQPALEIVRLSSEELATIFSERVLPVIERIARRDAPAAAVPPDRGHDGRALEQERHAGLARSIEETFASFKLPVEVMDSVEAPQLVRFFVRPGAGVKFVSLENRAEDLQVRLGLESPPLINPGKGAITLDVAKARPDTVHWRPELKSAVLPGPMAFVVGVGVGNAPLVANLADPNCAHALVAGATGSGKSEFLKAMLATLMSRNQPATLRLTLVDPKRLTFGPLDGSPFLDAPVITNLDETIPVLQEACDEMERRFGQLLAEGFNDLAARCAAGHVDLPWRIYVFDEFADLVLGARETRTEFEMLLKRLAQKGRAAGMHLVLATQRPDRNIVNSLIKANLPLKVCLRVTSQVNSLVMLDEPGGENLAGRGDLLCNRGLGIERAQSPYVQPDDFLKVAAVPTR